MFAPHDRIEEEPPGGGLHSVRRAKTAKINTLPPLFCFGNVQRQKIKHDFAYTDTKSGTLVEYSHEAIKITETKKNGTKHKLTNYIHNTKNKTLITKKDPHMKHKKKKLRITKKEHEERKNDKNEVKSK
jgi:hypothetical protein